MTCLVQVEDQGTPVRNDSMSCSININDLNDNVPVFTFPADTNVSVIVNEVRLRIDVHKVR